ncbi:enoyl-CoA hydratase/isomerase family protein [Rhodoferax sp.]|uniref:enoyl-CoA hydratase/isomerase family protein n=1 Tax=Rhodoferax sp. TaxID=50421 RepID=UPI0025CD0261|nr:enoyl-CoA hydratase/isomerase family protein [Rhodoferax sp.]
MNTATPTSAVLFDTLPTHSGPHWGVATLNAPAALNALSPPMVEALAAQLARWANDLQVAGVLLQASGDKAFCAGGDLRHMHQALVGGSGDPVAAVQGFFNTQYALDYTIHTYPKPILCWGHGIVMGGGLGLMAGASHRVVTPGSRLAMPEVSIGLYPDVGGSWFLRRMPGRVGLFLALTGAPLNAADALFCGLADHALPHTDKGALLQALAHAPWTHDAPHNRANLSRLLAQQAAATPLPASPVRTHFDQIQQLMAGQDLFDIDARLRSLQSDAPWLASAAAAYAQGCPTSAALAFALWQRCLHLSLAEVLRLEYTVSLGCCVHPNFAEGVRALLVDKDRNPRWVPARLADVTPAWVNAHFQPRHQGVHPLASLV